MRKQEHTVKVFRILLWSENLFLGSRVNYAELYHLAIEVYHFLQNFPDVFEAAWGEVEVESPPEGRLKRVGKSLREWSQTALKMHDLVVLVLEQANGEAGVEYKKSLQIWKAMESLRETMPEDKGTKNWAQKL